MKLTTRFFLVLLGMALIPLFLAGVWQAYQQRAVRENLFSLHQGVADFAASGIMEWFANVNRGLAFVSEIERRAFARRRQSARGARPAQASQKAGQKSTVKRPFYSPAKAGRTATAAGGEMAIIQQAVAANSDILSLVVLSPDGKETMRVHDSRVKSSDFPVNYMANALVQQVKSSNRASVGEVSIMGGYPVLPLAYPLSDERIVFLNFRLSKLWKKISSQTIGKTGKVIVAGINGKLLPGQSAIRSAIGKPQSRAQSLRAGQPFAKGGGQFAGQASDGDFPDINSGELENAISQGAGGVIKRLSSKSGTLAGAYRKIEGLPWIAVSLQSTGEVLGAQKRSLYGFILFSLIALIASLGLAYTLSQKISTPILSLVSGARRMASKDFSRQVPEQGWSEIRTLTSDFNKMMIKLKIYDALQVDMVMEEKTKAETLVNTITDGVILTDASDRIAYSNSAALRLLGLSQGVSGDIPLPGSIKRPEFRQGLEKVLREKTRPSSSEIELTVQSDPPVKKFYRIFSTPYSMPEQKQMSGVKSKAGGAVYRLGQMQEPLKATAKLGRVIVLRDITHEKEMDKMKDDFFHMITHDMRSPLGTVAGYLEMLVREVPPTPRTEKYFKNMKFSTGTLRGMVDDILNVNRLESGKMILQLKEISAEELLRRVQDAYDPVLAMKNVKIMVEPFSAPLIFSGDLQILERVISNLVGNAWKFTPAGGTIMMSCSRMSAQELMFAVSDTGPGIPREKREFIFEKFRQLEGHEYKGYGLGLAMCKMAVELHGGRIWVESEPGHGSKFIFTIKRRLHL